MYKHILFATDLSEIAEETSYITQKVQSMQSLTGAKVSLVHVIEPLPGYSYAYMGIEDVESQILIESRQILAKLGEHLHIPANDQYLEIGQAKAGILKVATKISADLIVCGSHGRHGLSLLLGSTANAILHGAKCDVLTVRLEE